MTRVLDDINVHFWLTRSVARVSGVNLSTALRSGAITADIYEQMVEACRFAGCADRCALWLAQQSGPKHGPPPFCAHADQLLSLRPH